MRKVKIVGGALQYQSDVEIRQKIYCPMSANGEQMFSCFTKYAWFRLSDTAGLCFCGNKIIGELEKNDGKKTDAEKTGSNSN